MPHPALSPSVLLATSMHAQPGVYAILLGSGVSTGAGIPTGWGVVTELVRRAAAASTPGDSESLQLAEADPAIWWSKHGAGELGYSSLLDALAPTAAARQGLLAGFFESTDEERQEGVKIPSNAHQAIAKLVKRGLVRVILTTNFDRLIEQALDAEGVAAQVLSRPESVNGMAPLAHASATIVKLHGDYKDIGARNTPEELSAYPRQWTRLLRQVFDEYGLLICGWSADWDTALVSALLASPNRRYPLYWDGRSSRGESARRILGARKGQIIPSADADELFGELLESVEALDRLAEPRLTTAMMIARLKRYLPDPVRRVDLDDLLMSAADDVAERIAHQESPTQSLTGDEVQELFAGHLRSVAPLIEMLVNGVWLDTDGAHDRLWADVLQRLVDAGSQGASSPTTVLAEARLWPALLSMTAIGVTAVRRDRDRLLIRLATEVQGREQSWRNQPSSAGDVLHPNKILNDNVVNAMPRWDGEKWRFPASHLLKADLRQFFSHRIPLHDDYEATFHNYEYRLGLIHERLPGYRAASGEFVLESRWSADGDEVPPTELAFRKASETSRDWPWTDFLKTDDLDRTLIEHRAVIEHYRGWP